MAGRAVPAKTRRHHDLPSELTSFIGRRRELSEVKRRLGTSRLVTLTGSGGVGKTRLALRVATEMARAFPDGVYLVQLASIADPMLVTQAIFTSLGLQDRSSRWSLSSLIDHLSGKRAMVVLDNCEHLLGACAVTAGALLRSCPQLYVLATSRQALGVDGEVRLRVPPLSVPDAGRRMSAEGLVQFESIALLADRGAAVAASFAIDESNVAVAIELCRRLDGIPLALELAAARLEAMGLEEINAALDTEHVVLSGNRGAEPRQQTLDATIDWSYRLLDADEKLLWARLSVFASGFDQEAVAKVCSGPDLPAPRIVELLASLVEKSIVKRLPGADPGRYELLETLRQFGRRRLREPSEVEEMGRRHAEWVLELAREAGSLDHREAAGIRRLHLERDNVWTALEFCQQANRAELGAQICRYAYLYWLSRGPIADARRIVGSLERLLPKESTSRAFCLAIGATLAVVHNDLADAVALGDEGLRRGRELGNPEIVARSSGGLILAAIAQQRLDEALTIANSVYAFCGSSPLWYVRAMALRNLFGVHHALGDLDAAMAEGEAALALAEPTGEQWLRGFILIGLADIRRRRGEVEDAEAMALQAAVCMHSLDDRLNLALVAEMLAWMAAERGSFVRTATLLGFAQQLRETVAIPLFPTLRAEHEAAEAAARGKLGDVAFTDRFKSGLELAVEDAEGLIADKAPQARSTVSIRIGKKGSPLTRRESEIARLIADGHTTREIAAKLFISERTVEAHVANSLNKLGLSSRIQLAGWVAGSTV